MRKTAACRAGGRVHVYVQLRLTAALPSDPVPTLARSSDQYVNVIPNYLAGKNAVEPLKPGRTFTPEETYYTHKGGFKRAMTSDLPALFLGSRGDYDNESHGFIGSHSATIEVLSVGAVRYEGRERVQDVEVRVVGANDTTIASFVGYATRDHFDDKVVNGIWLAAVGPFGPGAVESQTYDFTMTYTIRAH